MPDGQPGATLKPVKTTDVYRTHAAAGGAEQKYPSPGCRSEALAGANSVVFYATGAIVGNAIAPQPVAGHAADHPVCAGDGGLHSAFRRAGANAGPQSGVQARHRRRDGDRTGGRPGGSAEFFSAVLSRRDARRRLCRRGAQFSFCRHRRRRPGASRPCAVAGDGRRCGRRDHWPDAGHRHHAPLAGTYLRRHLPRSGAGCSAGRLFC